jgi:voltage-gated sodium channel
VADVHFNALIVTCIIIAGILVGVQSYPAMDGNKGLAAIDATIQIIFTFECLFKIFAEGIEPWVYWTGPERSWNNFDFWLVTIVWLPLDGGNVAFLRLLRLMRLLKLVGKVKQLQVIVVGLAKGLSSVSYIMVLMVLIFYLFAVAGVDTFRENDPFHFGSLGVAMLTLFRCATLEDWSDVM